VEHCPTEEIVADYFTKPLQGKKFYKFREKIMNLKRKLTARKEIHVEKTIKNEKKYINNICRDHRSVLAE